MKLFLKIVFIILSISMVVPSVMYLATHGTIFGFNTYYNFFINQESNKQISTITYLLLFVLLIAIYIFFINKKECFKNIKQTIIYISIISGIFVIMLPWTSSDIFYYMGVGELHSSYGQNPYYVTIKQYCDDKKEDLNDDSIIKQGYRNYWSNTTVVYGPVAQLIFSCITKLSFKNVNVCLLLFKLLNLIVHILNCYLIYKITKKLKFVIVYGLNPYILLEFMGNVHNDIIVVFFILLSLYFLLKKKQLLPSIIALSIATGIKYFTVLLLPVVILYHYRNEQKIGRRFLKCIQYGIIFVGVLLLEYAIFFRDISIFTAMMAQNAKLSKSIYSGIVGLGELHEVKEIIIFEKEFTTRNIAITLRDIVMVIFIITYIKFCIDLLTTKKIKLRNVLTKYNMELIIFLMALTTFQQWYIIWLFATIFWLNPNAIKSIIAWSLASEIANSIYMFKVESFKYDMHFWTIIACILVIHIIIMKCKKIYKGVESFGKTFIN